MQMLKITEAASMAIHALAVLAANPGKRLSSKDIAQTLGFSEAHLAKVFQRLARAGLAGSQRGPTGGFVLAQKPDDITLLQIFEAIEGPLTVSGCLLEHHECGTTDCPLGKLVKSVNVEVKDSLTHTTLAALCGSLALPRTLALESAAPVVAEAVQGVA